MRSRSTLAAIAHAASAAIGRTVLAGLLLLLCPPGFAYHYPWDQGHDTTTTVDPPKPGPEDKSCADPDISCKVTRSPVYAASGQAMWRAIDAQLIGRPYLGIYRVYNSNDPVVGLFGNGWSVDFDVALYPALAGTRVQRIFKAANGKRFVYERQADASYRTPAGRFDTVSESGSTTTMTQPDGQRLVFAADGRLLQRIDRNGNAVSFSYDAALRPVGMADGNGRTLALAYNAQGLVASVTDHGGRVWRYAYDAQGNLASVTDPLAGVRRYTWQAYKPPGDAQTYQQLLSAADPSGVVRVAYTYSGNQVASYTVGANRIGYSRSGSNTADGGTVTRTDSMGATSSFEYGALGLVVGDTDGMGGRSRFVYDANGRTTQHTDALGRAWTASYDSRGRLTASTNPLSQTSTFQYGAVLPYPTRTTTALGRVSTTRYDTAGNPLERTDPAGAVTRMGYDARGNMSFVQNALSQRTSVEYSAIGLPMRVTDALGRQSSFTYDGLGRMVTSTNPAGEATTFRYDALDRTTAVVDALNQTLAFAYDAAGRLASVTDPKGSVTRYEYDSHGRRSAEVAPDGRRTIFGYRNDNLLAQITWPDGNRITYDYDAAKRLTREVAGNETITFAYNALHQLISATGPGGAVAYTYDNAGRVVAETSNGRTSAITLNADGEASRIDYLGQTLNYTRDGRGLVTRIATPAGNFDFSHDALGRRSQLTYPNGSTAQSSYDAAGQLTALAHAGAFAASFQHSFDAAGRLTRMVGDGADWTYGYDALGRLTRATQGASSTTYTFDAVGNLTTEGRTHDVNHRLSADSAKNYSHDQRGNLTLEQNRSTGARVAYTWNLKNQLLRVDFYPAATGSVPSRTLQYSYDPLGRRASKTDAGAVERFVYDGDALIGTLDGSNNVTSVNVFSGETDEPLASTSGGTTRLLYADRLGSIVAVGSGASVTHRYRYGPYGETLAGSSADSIRFRYTGREKDTDALYHYRARYYSSAMQRFVSADPIGMVGGLSTYAYVEGDPINQTDPSGLAAPAILVPAAAGAAFEFVWQVGGNLASGKSFGDSIRAVEVKKLLAGAVSGALKFEWIGKLGQAGKKGWLALKALDQYRSRLAIKLFGKAAVPAAGALVIYGCEKGAETVTESGVEATSYGKTTVGDVWNAIPPYRPQDSYTFDELVRHGDD